MRRRHIPQRTCIACRKVRNKRDLVRIVRTPDGEVLVDPTGKRSGRGAYLCRAQGCWHDVLASGGRRLEQALKAPIKPEALTALQGFAAGLPLSLPEEDQGAEAKALA